jgi:hypothetical protein
VRQLVVKASVVPSSPILVTLMKEALSSSETSVLIRSTQRNNPEDAILNRICSKTTENKRWMRDNYTSWNCIWGFHCIIIRLQIMQLLIKQLLFLEHVNKQTNKISVAFSPQANYTD